MGRRTSFVACVAAALVVLFAARARAESGNEGAPAPAARFEGRRGDLVIGAERLVPLVRYSEDATRHGDEASLGWGFLDRPRSIHDVPRVAIDVAVAERVTVGAAPIVTIGSPGSRYALGLTPRVGFVLPLARRLSLWPSLGAVYAYVSAYESKGHQLAFSADAPFVFAVAEHVGVSLGVGMGAPIVNARGAFRGATSVKPFHLGIAMGLLAWF